MICLLIIIINNTIQNNKLLDKYNYWKKHYKWFGFKLVF